MPTLPQFQSKVPELNLMQNSWGSILAPVLKNPLVNGQLLMDVELASGNNIVYHKLGRPLTGWILTRVRDNAASIYDSQDTNPQIALTLVLNASTAVVVDLYVF